MTGSGGNMQASSLSVNNKGVKSFIAFNPFAVSGLDERI
jgi:hypothetical protein